MSGIHVLFSCLLSCVMPVTSSMADDTITPATVNLEDLILIDYRERSSTTLIPLPTYHQSLLDYMKPISAGGQGLAPPRLILYVNSPCAGTGQPGCGWYDFYNPNADCSSSGDLTFIGFLKQMHDFVPGTELEILVDYSSATDWANDCWTTQTPASFPVPLTSNWTGLPDLMEWVRAIYTNLATNCAITAAENPLKGISFDSEVTGQT